MATPHRQTKPQAPPPTVSLGAVKRGKVESPMRIAIYGVEGIGKSSFAAGAPGVVFLDAEKGTTKLDVSRYDVESWPQLFSWIDALTREPHDFKTVALDTLDALEQQLWRFLCETKNWDGIEDAGFGKGYVAALEHWRDLVARLERLQTQRSMNVIFTAHALIKPFKNPEGDDFDRYQLKIHDKAGGLLKGWCDTVLFAQYETFAVKDDKTKRVRGISSGSRLLRTQRTAAYDAKNRDNLPESLPLDWQAFAEAVAANAPLSAEKQHARINEMLKSADPELCSKVLEAIKKNPDDAAYLARVADKLQSTLALKAQENES